MLPIRGKLNTSSHILIGRYVVLNSTDPKGKGKAIPLQAWTGPKDSRRMRIPDFKTIGTWMW